MLNQKYIEIYYDTVFSYCEGLIPLRSFSEKDKGEIVFPSWIEANKDTALSAIKTFAEYVDKKQASALCIPGTVKERGQARALDIQEMQVLVVDIDTGDIEAKLTHARIHLGIPTLIVESGGEYEGQKKLHVYWKLNEAATGEDLANLIEMRRKLALKIGGDVHFASAHQPIRIAGTIYHKSDEARLVNIREHTGLEYSLYDLEDNIVYMPGLTGIDRGVFEEAKATKAPVDSLFRTEIRAGNLDDVSRFSAISTVIGYWLKRVRKNDVTPEEALEEIRSYNIARISPPWDEEKLNTEIRRLWKRDVEKYGEFTPIVESDEKPKQALFKCNKMGVFFRNKPDAPEPYLGGGILPAKSFFLFAGPPKIGKSYFTLNLLTHMALGRPYLDVFTPTKPLRVFYIQVEVDQLTLWERFQDVEIMNESLALELEQNDNFTSTEATSIILNDKNIQKLLDTMKDAWKDRAPDVICLDPLRNTFFSDGKGNTNSEEGMTEYCLRIEALRDKINPAASIILVHHTKKIDTKMIEEDPFNMVAGSSFLRSYCDTTVVAYRPNQKALDKIVMHFEVRNRRAKSARVDTLHLLLKDGKFIIDDEDSNTKSNKNTKSEKKTKDQKDKNIELHEQLIGLIKSEALEGRFYTIRSFGGAFANKEGLPSDKTIRRNLDELAAQQSIKFFDNPESYGFEESYKVGSMFVCIHDMNFKIGGNYGVIKHTHFKCPSEDKIKIVKN